jgi:hypothetical protein
MIMTTTTTTTKIKIVIESICSGADSRCADSR